MRWFACVWLAVAACSMGQDPKPPPPPAVVPTGTVTGKVTFEMNGPGRDHRPEESFTHVSPIDCLVRAGSAEARTGSDGSYTLTLPVGHHEVSFAGCAKGCCESAPATHGVDLTAGEVAPISWACVCYAK